MKRFLLILPFLTPLFLIAQNPQSEHLMNQLGYEKVDLADLNKKQIAQKSCSTCPFNKTNNNKKTTAMVCPRVRTPQIPHKNEMKWVTLCPQGLKLTQSSAKWSQEHPYVPGFAWGPFFCPKKHKILEIQENSGPKKSPKMSLFPLRGAA